MEVCIVMEVYSADKSNNLANWITQRDKLVEFIHNLINENLKYGEVLDRTQTWNTAQAINFLFSKTCIPGAGEG